jgi:hypothetical protein
MSIPQKPRGQSEGKPVSELTRFKLVWRDSLSEEARGFWRERFGSADTQAALRKEISAKLKITLKSDNQLTCFRQWLARQDEMDEEAAQAEEEEARILHEHPDWTKDQVREDLLRRFYNRARATGDSKLGLATMRVDRGLIQVKTDREKFEFDAAKACLKALPALKVISTNKTLSEADKVNAIRQKLFAVLPK